MNFAKGILESRTIHYRHLKNLLVCGPLTSHYRTEWSANLIQKIIPLETPTEIELALGHMIQVTLFDVSIYDQASTRRA